MPLLAQLNNDVESIIFSYIIEVPDIIRLLRVNKSFHSTLPHYITHVRWRGHAAITCKFLLPFENIRHIYIPVLINTTVDDLLTIIRRKHLQRLCIFLTSDLQNPPDDPYYLKTILSNTSYDITIQTCKSYRLRPQISYQRGNFVACIGTPELFIKDSKATYLDSLSTEITTICKYRPIQEISCSLDFYTFFMDLSIPSIKSYEWASSLSCMEYIWGITLFIRQHPNLTKIKQSFVPGIHARGLRNYMPCPAIDRPFEFLLPIIPERIPVILGCFPQLKRIALYIEQNDFRGGIEHINILIERGIPCIIYTQDMSNILLQLFDIYRNPLVTVREVDETSAQLMKGDKLLQNIH